ncbi:hypothetical protein IOC57_08145 [Bacillus sp. SD075]|uniref:hypothetical protein n=1 Tax=Bacillus sp. SD075 TaxID=2781732 RepID=UPI001A96698E|nr:hypothetical protein [Bacillus sp. SD075]MBO0997716.1 hypothetical protein [Bacillus sp. SD075]
MAKFRSVTVDTFRHYDKIKKSMANIQEEIKTLQDIHNILMTRLYNIEHFTNSYRKFGYCDKTI